MKNAHISKELENILMNFGISNIISDDMDYIDVFDQDIITFTPIDKVEKIKDSGKDPWKTNRISMKVGKFLNKNICLKDSAVENLVNRYKTLYKINKGDWNDILTIVKGKDILYWYDYRNYVQGGGSLNGSCMRGVAATNPERLDMYVENPDVCNLLIMKEGDKLLARALMWKTDKGIYIDRCYCRYDNDQHLYKRYAEQNKYFNYYNRGIGLNIPLKIRLNKHYSENCRPYLDSFSHNGRELSTII
jgi:hypothetical protein